MVKMTSLEIGGYRNQDVPNSFWQQNNTHHLAVVLPGYGYSADMPVLYYPGRLLTNRGADLLQVKYDYPRNPEYTGLDAGGQAAWLYADAMAATEAGLRQRDYTRITLVGKSLGTMAIAHLLGDKPEFSVGECIWLTPVLDDPLTYDRLQNGDERGLVVIGTADHYYSTDKINTLQKRKNLQVVVYEGADHSLEIPGDLPSSIRLMERYVAQVEEFLFK